MCPARRDSAALETMHMVTIDDVRRLARSLPRSEDQVPSRTDRPPRIRSRRKTMGFAFPKEWRAGLVEAETDKFCMPEASDVRYNWVCVRLEAIDEAEMRTLVTEAWRFVVPKRVAAEHLDEGSSRRRRRPRIDRPRS
jgi:hypothetical protein